MIELIKKIKCTCDKCGHKWEPKNNKIPVLCAKCKTQKWNDLQKKERNHEDNK